jgi:hypothetical protein
VAAIAVTEPGAGSDVAAITTSAVRDDAGYRLTGRKVCGMVFSGRFSPSLSARS